MFFRDGARRIDFVLSYVDEKDGERKQVRNKIYRLQTTSLAAQLHLPLPPSPALTCTMPALSYTVHAVCICLISIWLLFVLFISVLWCIRHNHILLLILFVASYAALS